METNWKKLQNGSDIRGVALDGIVNEPVNLTPEIVETLGKSFIYWLKSKGLNDISIAIGMDSRLSGPSLKAAFIKGVTSQGVNCIDCGIASTPAMFMSTLSEKIKVEAAVMLTASHLPFNRNGLKFFTKNGGLDKKDISDLLEIAATIKFPDTLNRGNETKYDLISEYSEILVKTIKTKASSSTIILTS